MRDANSSSNPLANPAVIVDANHSNSGKKFEEQIRISKDVLHSCKMSADIHKLVKGTDDRELHRGRKPES